MQRHLPSDPASPIAALAPAAPLRLQSRFVGRADTLLQELETGLSACGAWVAHPHPQIQPQTQPQSRLRTQTRAIARPPAEIRFELLLSAAWDLYALLAGSGLDLSPCSHQHLQELCNMCLHPGQMSAGLVIEIHLRISLSHTPFPLPCSYTAGRGLGFA